MGEKDDEVRLGHVALDPPAKYPGEQFYCEFDTMVWSSGE